MNLSTSCTKYFWSIVGLYLQFSSTLELSNIRQSSRTNLHVPESTYHFLNFYILNVIFLNWFYIWYLTIQESWPSLIIICSSLDFYFQEPFLFLFCGYLFSFIFLNIYKNSSKIKLKLINFIDYIDWLILVSWNMKIRNFFSK